MASMAVRELLVRIRATFDKRGTDEAKRGVSKFSKSVSNLNKKALAGLAKAAKVASVAAAGVGVAMVKAAADAEESESKFEAVFKDQAGEARAWSEQLAETIGRSGFQMREFASSLQDTFVPLGFARDTASQLSRNLVELSEDVASFQNKATPDVMRDFQSALVGNHETVRKYGIIITQERLDEKIAAMAKESRAFAKQSEAMQKVLARNKIIFEGTTDAQGDATRTAGSFTNQMRAMMSRIKDTAVVLGTQLLPLLLPVVKQINEWVAANKDAIRSGFSEFVKALVASVKILSAVVRGAYTVFKDLAFILGAMYESFSELVFVKWIRGLMDAYGWTDAIAKKIGQVASALGLGPSQEEAIEAARRGAPEAEIRQRALEQTRENLVKLRGRGVESVRGIRLDDAGIERLVGLTGNRLQQQMMGPATTTNNMRQINPQANITVNVPPGTNAAQAQRVAEATGVATRTALRQATADVAR
jgi:hypothetical protein